MVLVLNLRFGQGGFERNRPVDRLLAAIDQLLVYERSQCSQDLCFVGGVLGFIFMVPVAQNAQSFKLSALDGNPMLRKGVALFPQFSCGHLFASCSDLLGDLMLDG